MKVLVSSNYLGGAGGLERALYSMVRALEPDSVDVVVRRQLSGPLARVGEHARVHNISSWRWRGAARDQGLVGKVMGRVLNPLRRKAAPSYDVYLQSRHAMNIGEAADAKLRLLIPSGNMVPAVLAEKFDFVALQAPGNLKFVPEGIRTTLLPPPVFDLAVSSQRPETNLPERYYLTVFNPYGPIKGVDDLDRSIDSAPLPLVWCHSEATRTHHIPERLRDHPNIVHVIDPSHAELQFLYEHCSAYVCFSRSEGFGWSIADAIRASKPVISRKVGLLTFPEAAQQVPVSFMGEEWEKDWPDTSSFTKTSNSSGLSLFSPERFRENLIRLTTYKVKV